MRAGPALLTALVLLSPPAVQARFVALFEPDAPERVELVLDSKTFKRYQKLILRASTGDDRIIDERYKVDMPARLVVAGRSSKAKMRIQGDWKDHLSTRGGSILSSSLAIKMSQGNVGGITRLRLLLPETRNGDEHVFWSALMESIGYPTPYARNVTLVLNGVAQPMILQETPAKEMMERFGITESPLLRQDERQMWHNRRLKGSTLPVPVSAKLLNAEYIKDSPTKALIAMNAASAFARSATVDHHDRPQPEASRFPLFDWANVKYAPHGIGHNRRFIFDPMVERLIPVYGDGSVELAPCDRRAMQAVTLRPDEQATMDGLRDRLRQRTGKDFTPQQACAATDVIVAARRLPVFAPRFGEPQFDSFRVPAGQPLPLAEPFAGAFRVRALALDRGRFRTCTADEGGRLSDCGDVALDEVKRWLGADLPAGDGGLYPVVMPQPADWPPRAKLARAALGDRDLALSVPADQWLHVHLEPSSVRRRLSITLLGDGSRALLTGTVSAGDTIELRDRTPHAGESEAERVDSRMLTGCLTLIDAQLLGGSVSVQGAHCEDSVNLIRARGRLDSVRIVGAAQDALDADFSDLTIGQVLVQGAGNDCIDVSYGRYRFDAVRVEGCSDKGVSIGERSQATLGSVHVTASQHGVVAKDLARVQVDRLDADVRKNCVAAYQKKSEHGGGTVVVRAMACRGSVSHDDVSTIDAPAR